MRCTVDDKFDWNGDETRDPAMMSSPDWKLLCLGHKLFNLYIHIEMWRYVAIDEFLLSIAF